MKHKKAFIVDIFIVAIALFLLIVTKVRANTAIYEISDFDDLVEAAELSRANGNQNYTFKLMNDIEITQENQNSLENSEFKYISFGTSENPFSGTFDGQGHYIANLKYSSSLSAISDTGLFSYTTTGAIIKDLTILNADIQADYRGGIISGYSTGTVFENITIKDSHLFVSAISNVITLITDGGIRGGAIVGEADNCILYNCEVTNTRINTNNTSGVAALAGKGLYLGGLVGTSVSTEVEYSRVIGGLVKNYYDVVVGAVGGNTVYAGGIIGQMKNGSKVIDSFSTAELNFYCATYVAVGAGNTGHIGGITAAMYGERNEIIRCHYAGKATSRQYNAVLVIPIIQDNVNISGIADVYEGGSVVNTHFKPSVNDGVSMNVLGNNSSTSSYGPLNDIRYVDKDYWQTQNYDFYGNIKRQTGYNSNHTNKWVIDNSNNIPIHGKSISASIDFSDAGTVTIDSSELVNSQVSTNKAPLFAVQGYKLNEKNTNILAEENEGYRFVSWYKVPNITVWNVDENHEFYDEIFTNNEVYSREKNLNNIDFEDNDLYAAYYQARVLFHDINGDIIDVLTGSPEQSVQESDWYDYLSDLPEMEPDVRPTSETARLIGWTTTMSNESGGGYSSITAPALAALKNNNTFYETGDKITKTLILYPVYMDLISNINTVFEGNEQDSLDDVSLRDGVGETSVSMNENDEVVIKVTGSEQDGAFPDGYRFLGWYDETNMRVSRDQEFILTDVDLSIEHTYTAKFEYSIEYYVKAFVQDYGHTFTESELYTTKWQEYNTLFESIPGPSFIREMVTHWGSSHVNHEKTDNNTDSYSGNIVAPLKVYSHNYNTVSGNNTPYQVSMTMDFPGSGQIVDEYTGGVVLGKFGKFKYTPISERYHLLFWTLEKDGEGWSYANNPMDTGNLGVSLSYTYKGMAIVTTDIKFYKKDNDVVTVTRKYEDNIFMAEQTIHTYKYSLFDNNKNTEVAEKTSDSPKQDIINKVTLQASPNNSDMQVDGYAFLGWISSAEVPKNGNVWNNIYDVTNDLYCTSDISKVKPYLLSGNELVYETQDIYPVYAKWDITTKTNVKNLGGLYNVPPNPGYTNPENISNNGEALITITPNENTYISGNSGAIYELLELVRVYDDGTEEVIELNNNSYKYKVEAGQKYVFMAKYRPYTVIYHLNEGDIKIVIRNHLDVLGEIQNPTFSIGNNGYVFMGWTDQVPENGKYHSYLTNSSFENDNLTMYNENTVVLEALELWPVYVKVNLNINSNIDSLLEQNNNNLEDTRYITRPTISETQINAESTALGNYVFEGWYKNYQSNSNKGELITNNLTYIFENDESSENNTYTAVYKRIININYHNTSREIIYTAYIGENEERSFVREELDNDNNTMMVPIDSQAYEEIYNSLAPNEVFVNWQWQVNSETISQWDSFYNETITTNMDLYPIIIKVDMKDPDNNNIDITVGNNNDKICICLNSSYEKPYTSVHISEISIGANSTSEQNLNNIQIDLYKNNDITGEPIANGVTDINGNSTLYVFGEIVVTQNTSNQNNDVFIYQLLDTNNNVINEFNISLGESKTLKVPYGRYKVKRKKSWAWRYAKVTSDVIVINNQNNNQEIIFEGNRVTNKWFDKSTYIDNEY